MGYARYPQPSAMVILPTTRGVVFEQRTYASLKTIGERVASLQLVPYLPRVDLGLAFQDSNSTHEYILVSEVIAVKLYKERGV